MFTAIWRSGKTTKLSLEPMQAHHASRVVRHAIDSVHRLSDRLR